MAVSTSAELQEEVRLLRGELDALLGAVEARRHIALGPVPPGPSRFLGQPVRIVARVTNGRGEPAGPDVPVTFVATWGRLRGSDGYSFQEGHSLTLRTGVDGAIRVTLRAPTSEDAWDVQQAALESALASLDPTAATPREAESGLRDMVLQYRWDAGLQLRNAVDIYFQDFRSALLDTINYRDCMQEWAYFDSVVLAYVGDEGDAASVQATAVLRLRFKDWLGPWLETFLSQAGGEGKLGEALAGEKTPGRDASSLLEGVYGRVRDFVGRERGLAGNLVARRVAEASVREFVTSGVADLPLETRTALFPALETATAVIASSGMGVLAAMGQTRADLRREVDAKVAAIDVSSVRALEGRVGALEGQVSSKADLSALQNGLASKADRSALEAGLAGKPDTTTFERAMASKVGVTAFEAALEGKVDTSAFESALKTKVDTAALQAALNSKADVSTVNAGLAAKADAKVFQAALARKVDTTAFETALASKVDASTFSAFRTQTERALDGKAAASALAGKVDVSAFDVALSKKADTAFVQSGLATKVDNSTFQSALAAKVDVAAFNTFSSSVDTRFATIQSDFGRLNTSVSGLAGDLTRFQTSVNGSLKTLNDSTAALGTRVDGVQGTVSTLDHSVTSLGNNLQSFKVDVARNRNIGPVR